MPAFFTAAHLKLSLLLSILGAVVALIFTIMSNSGAVALVVRPLVSALLMFVLGSSLYALLAKKVPEAIDAIEHDPDLLGHDFSEDGEVGDGSTGEVTGESDESFEGSGKSNMADYDPDARSSGLGSSLPRKMGVTIGKEEIVVDGVKFKNQPEVMAETIKQLMDQDKD